MVNSEVIIAEATNKRLTACVTKKNNGNVVVDFILDAVLPNGNAVTDVFSNFGAALGRYNSIQEQTPCQTTQPYPPQSSSSQVVL